jgi:hypothetical protein
MSIVSSLLPSSQSIVETVGDSSSFEDTGHGSVQVAFKVIVVVCGFPLGLIAGRSLVLLKSLLLYKRSCQKGWTTFHSGHSMF